MQKTIEDILNYDVCWNTIQQILISLLIFLVLFFLVNFLLKRLDKINENKSDKKWLNYISSVFYKIPKWLFIAIEIYIAISFLKFSEQVNLVLKSIFLFILTIFLIKVVIKCINVSLDKVLSKDKTAKNTLETIVKVIVWCFWIFILLFNLWINLTPLLAWFWVAWIAVAFALQNILTDLFSSFSIILSKPFVVGDYIKIWEWSSEKIWTVKQITLKSTTLQTVQWQEVIVPNSNVLATEVINYRTMKHRRQRISISVTYDTWLEKLKLIPEIVKKIVSSQDNVEYERCYLEKMWESSINFLMSYDILSPDYQDSLVVNEKIYLKLIEEFEKDWIEFAFPSQTIYMKK